MRYLKDTVKKLKSELALLALIVTIGFAA